MRIRLTTVRFNGEGSIDCRKCSRRTGFPDGAWVIIYDYGATQIVQSAYTKAILHECGREFFWQCDDCGGEPNITLGAKHFRGRRVRALRCACGGEYKQHRLEIVGEPEEVRVPATPF